MKPIVAIVTAIATVSLFGILTPGASAQGNGSAGLDAAGYKEMIEDIEVMRRILVKSLLNHLKCREGAVAKPLEEQALLDAIAESEQKEKDSNVFESLHLYTTVLNGVYKQWSIESRGFFVPGSGVVYSLQIPVPALEQPEGKKKENAGDIWEKTEKEFRRGETHQVLKKGKASSWVIDEKAVDAVVDFLIATVAKQAPNMEHLEPDDHITLLLDFKGRTRLNRFAGATGNAALKLYTDWSAASSPGLFQDVIVQIPVSVLPSYETTGDISIIKRSVRIKKYPGTKKSHSLSSGYLSSEW